MYLALSRYNKELQFYKQFRIDYMLQKYIVFLLHYLSILATGRERDAAREHLLLAMISSSPWGHW